MRAGLCALALLTGCVPVLRNDFRREPELTVPDSFGQVEAPAEGEPSSVAMLDWTALFADPNLSTLLETALENNRELNSRVQEVLIASFEAMARTGEYLPRVNAVAGLGEEKVGEFTSQGASDIALDLPDPIKDHRLGFSASWEVDIWRRLRNSAKAATFRWLAGIEGRKFLVTRLVAEVASSYYELMALDRQLEVLRRNIGLQQDALAIVRIEKQAARVTELAVQRFEAEVLKNQSRQYDFEQQIVQIENRINFLVGRFPQPILREPAAWDTPLPDEVRTGLPTDLLENRPDVRQAELVLEASKLDVKAARARFYPALGIDGGLGFHSYDSGHLLDTPESFVFDVGGNLVTPLFNRRGIKAEYFTADAEQGKAVLEYEQTVLQAFSEVANQLALIGNLQKSYELEARQVALLEQAIDVSNTLFQSARADYMEVLLTRRDSLDAQMELIETRLRQKQALVHVYQALGGGWR